MVFDELHFGKFVNGYVKGEYFFDIHPPFSKLLIAFAARHARVAAACVGSCSPADARGG